MLNAFVLSFLTLKIMKVISTEWAGEGGINIHIITKKIKLQKGFTQSETGFLCVDSADDIVCRRLGIFHDP